MNCGIEGCVVIYLDRFHLHQTFILHFPGAPIHLLALEIFIAVFVAVVVVAIRRFSIVYNILLIECRCDVP